MKLNELQVIYSQYEGFGIVTYRGTNYSNVFFPKYHSTKTIKDSSLTNIQITTNVSFLTVSDIINLELLDPFFNDPKIKARGKKYYVDRLFEVYEHTDNCIKAEFYGSDYYNTSIEFNKGVIKLKCSCPYEYLCKHLYALIIYVKTESQFDYNKLEKQALLNFSNNDQKRRIPKPVVTIDKKVEEFIEKLKEIRDYRLLYKEVKNFLYENKDNNKIFEDLAYIFIFEKPFSYTLFNDYVGTTIAYYSKSKKAFEKYDPSFFDTINYETSLNEEFFFTIRFLINNQYEEFNKAATDEFFLINKQEYSQNKYIYNVLLEEIKNIDISNNLVMSNLVTFATTNNDRTYIYSNIKNKKDADIFLMHFLSSEQNTNLFKKINPSTFFEYLNENPEEYSYLNINAFLYFLNLLDPETEYLDIFINFINYYNYTSIIHRIGSDKNKIKNILKKLPKNKFILKLFDYLFEDYEETFEPKIINPGKILECINSIKENYFDSSLSDYFAISIKNHLNSSITFTFEIKKIKKPILVIVFYNDYCNISELLGYEISTYKNYDEEYEKGELFYSIIEKTFNTLLPSEKENLINGLKTICEYFYKSTQKKFLSKINEIIKNNENKNTNLYNNVEITPCIYENSGEISLLIGDLNFKQYKVPSIKKLIEHFKTKYTKKYGKNFVFKHDLESLDAVSKKLVIYFLTLDDGEKYYYNSVDVYSKLSYENLRQILEIYKNKEIYVNGQLYLVTLSNVDSKIKVNKDLKLTIEDLPQNCRYFGSTSFILDTLTKEIKLPTNNDFVNQLIETIKNSPYPSIEDNEPLFKYDVLLNAPHFFEIEESIEDRFNFDNLEINSYFDFENKEIVLKTVLRFENKEVKIRDLDENCLKLYHKYQNVISKLGFDNGIMNNPDNIFKFFNDDLIELKKISNIYLSESITSKTTSQFVSPIMRIDNKSNLLNIFLENSIYSDEELFEISNSLRKNKKYVILKERIIDLTNNDAKEFNTVLNDFNLIEDKKVKKSITAPLYNAFKLTTTNLKKNINSFVEEIIDEVSNFKSKDLPLPKIDAELRNYQIEGFNWLSILYKYGLGGILADDMGLGKTLEIITFIASLKIKKPILIILPASLIYNWISEFNRFASYEEIIPIYGNLNYRTETIKNIKKNKTIYITSYETLRSDIELYNDIEFEIAILDEAQFIKNSLSKKAEAVKEIKSSHKFVLTGTPIENSILDLWSIFDFIMPNYFPPISIFKSKFESDEHYKTIIKKRISPFILRRNKADVLKDLPSKYEMIVSTALSASEQKLYDSERLKAKKILLSGNKDSKFKVLQYFTILREICIDPSLYYENFDGKSSKIETLKGIVKQEISDGNKLIIFSQFVKALNKIENMLNKNNIPYTMITSSTPSKERLNISNDFNMNDTYKVILVSLKAGGTGLNLVGANVVIHVDPWWNYAVEAQASDRAHRIGQQKNVKVIKLITDNTIEQNVIELQNKKKELAKQIISDDDSNLTALSKEDIEFILK